MMPDRMTAVLIATMFLAAGASARTNQGKEPFRLDADAVRFAGAESLTNVRVYYGVPEGSLTYRSDGAGRRKWVGFIIALNSIWRDNKTDPFPYRSNRRQR